eukprot:scaffold251356_cov63-Attheya_sp.AAC.2
MTSMRTLLPMPMLKCRPMSTMTTMTWMRTLIIRHRVLPNLTAKLEMTKRKKYLYPVSGQDVKQIMTTSRSKENRKTTITIGIRAVTFMIRSRAHL